MADDCAGASENAIEPVLALPASIIAPTLSVVVEVLEKIADNLTTPK
jgi:hypothetical protein